jgi:glycosyltransferase A (GT-A) superfamily protein (DUF2064 family)
MLSNNHLIIFTRFPEPGKTKTRLIPALGPEKAAELQQKMTERIASYSCGVKLPTLASWYQRLKGVRKK